MNHCHCDSTAPITRRGTTVYPLCAPCASTPDGAKLQQILLARVGR